MSTITSIEGLSHLVDMQSFLVQLIQLQSIPEFYNSVSVARMWRSRLTSSRSPFSTVDEAPYFSFVLSLFDVDADGNFVSKLEGIFSNDFLVNRMHQIIVFVLAFLSGKIQSVSESSYVPFYPVKILPVQPPVINLMSQMHHSPNGGVYFPGNLLFQGPRSTQVFKEIKAKIEHTSIVKQFVFDTYRDVVVDDMPDVSDVERSRIDSNLKAYPHFKLDPLLIDFDTGRIHDVIYKLLILSGMVPANFPMRFVDNLSTILNENTVSCDGVLQITNSYHHFSESFYRFLKDQEQKYVDDFRFVLQKWGSSLKVFTSFRLSMWKTSMHAFRVLRMLRNILRDGFDLDAVMSCHRDIDSLRMLKENVWSHFLVLFLGRVVMFDSKMVYDFDPYGDVFVDAPPCALWRLLDFIRTDNVYVSPENFTFKDRLWYACTVNLADMSYESDCYYNDPCRNYHRFPDVGWIDSKSKLDNRYLSSPASIEIVKALGESYVCNSDLSRFPREIYEKILRYVIYEFGEHRLFMEPPGSGLMGKCFVRSVYAMKPSWYPMFRNDFNVVHSGFSTLCGQRYWLPKPVNCGYGSELCEDAMDCYFYDHDNSTCLFDPGDRKFICDDGCNRCNADCELQWLELKSLCCDFNDLNSLVNYKYKDVYGFKVDDRRYVGDVVGTLCGIG